MLQVVHQGDRGRRGQHLGGVRHGLASRQDDQALDAGVEQGLGDVRATQHDVRDALLGLVPEVLVHRRVAQVQVDQQDGVVDFAGQADRQVHGGERLALARAGAGDGERPPALLFHALQDLGPQHLVGREDRRVVGAGKDPVAAQDVAVRLEGTGLGVGHRERLGRGGTAGRTGPRRCSAGGGDPGRRGLAAFLAGFFEGLFDSFHGRSGTLPPRSPGGTPATGQAASSGEPDAGPQWPSGAEGQIPGALRFANAPYP